MKLQSIRSGQEPSRTEIDAFDEPTVIEFGTSWCGYCVTAQPLIALALRRHPRVHHIKIEDGPGRSLGRSFRIKLWPTLVFLGCGKEVDRLVRPSDPHEIEQALAQIDVLD